MKFYIYRTSDFYPQDGEVVEINTLETLITLFHSAQNPLVLNENYYTEFKIDDMVRYGCPREKAEAINDCKYSIEIYDDYRE